MGWIYSGVFITLLYYIIIILYKVYLLYSTLIKHIAIVGA